ncbi:Thymidylate kinase [Candidatus Arcanobacter lacustris]|jgi:dTMP kinase|uniref:Thymidylate kinase n=1 Tax=Candidatus Arcanibacter lacustris TaxID=1607817 RepID=A0A0F5MN55_9RICK|nr:Thymidylate kinase [Candidatus Arcanobacter lacustris]
MSGKAKFITFEGIDGSGKSTQVEILRKLNLPNLHCTCPAKLEESNLIRSLLLDKNNHWDAKTEIALHSAARNELVQKIIKPKLKEGSNVICDRYLDSTIAYQAYGGCADLEIVTKLHQILIENLMPDLTFILDIDPKISLERIAKRAGKTDRYELMSLDYHNRVRNGYLEIAKNDPDRCIVIDSLLAKDEISAIIFRNLEQRLGISL